MRKRKRKSRSKGKRSEPSDGRTANQTRQEQPEEIYHPSRIKRGTTNEARTQLEVLAEMLRRVVERLQAMRDPDQRTITLANLGWRSAIEADRVATALGGSVDKIAWPTRNLYELNLRIRHLLADPENVTRFREEMVSDQIKLLEALHSLFDKKDVEERKAIQGRIDFRRQQLAKEGMKEVPQMMAAQLAESVGVKPEHDRFYKLYSKYVHPSAHLIMSGQPSFKIFDRYSRHVFTLNAQQYARDTLQLIAEATGTDIEALKAGPIP